MDSVIARSLLERELDAIRARGYRHLRGQIGTDIDTELTGPDGVCYQLKILVLWDSEASGAIRIIGSIDDGGLRTFLRPLTMDHLLQPDNGA
jgi:hypothetical protein